MARKTDTDDETPTLSADEKFELLLEALTQKQAPGIDLDALRVVMTETQKAVHKELKPQNETHPGISAFSYPEGDVARPRVTLPFEFFYNAYPCHKFPETEHWRELELMAQVTPGVYTVIRKDGSKMSVDVKGDRDADGKLTKLTVEFPVSREEKWLVPPKSVVLYQIVHKDKTPKRAFLEAMQEYLLQTMGEEAAV